MTPTFQDTIELIAAAFPCALSLYLIITACVQVIFREAAAPSADEKGAARSVTVLVPAHNEERTLADCLDSLLQSCHPDLRIWVLSDGSTDGTVEIARSFGPRGVRVIEFEKGIGKSAALDAALDEIETDLVLVVDADTRLAADAISKLASPFSAASLGAVTANIRVQNERGLLARMQAVEYASIIGLLKRSNSMWGGFSP